MIKARHILETVLYAEDLSAARRFYGEVLGLPVYQEVEGRLVFFRCAGQMLLLFNPKLSSSQSSGKGRRPMEQRAQAMCVFAAPLKN